MTMGKLFDKLLNRKKERHPRCAALVPAAGRSERMGGTDKLTAPLCGVPVLLRTLRALDEAALIDGASAPQRFFKITLPMLSPVIFFNLLMGIITAFKTFTESMVITNGGPFDKTLVYALYIYRQSFQYYKMGYSSAIAVILFIMLLIVTIIQWVHNSKEEKG